MDIAGRIGFDWLLKRGVSRHSRFGGMHEEESMGIQALFGLSVLMSFVAFGLVTKLYIWPRLRLLERDDALVPIDRLA